MTELSPQVLADMDRLYYEEMCSIEEIAEYFRIRVSRAAVIVGAGAGRARTRPTLHLARKPCMQAHEHHDRGHS